MASVSGAFHQVEFAQNNKKRMRLPEYRCLRPRVLIPHGLNLARQLLYTDDPPRGYV